MTEILKNFLTNQIIVDWVAPLITGVILFFIPTGIIRFFQTKKDTKKISLANERFLNSVRPYIIQKINVDKEFISDIRDVIIKESCIKEKYIYTELELRNKLIMDITEDNYINESNKKELIDFTYRIFSNFNINLQKNNNEKLKKKKRFMNIDRYLILFVISIVFCIFIEQISKDGTNIQDNPIYAMSYVSSFFSLIIMILSYLKSIFKSNISVDRKISDKFFNFFFEEVEDEKYIKETRQIKIYNKKDKK